ncbi:MAG: hypothetical protein ACRDBQ_19215 [Shewanella sp.]
MCITDGQTRTLWTLTEAVDNVAMAMEVDGLVADCFAGVASNVHV